MNYDEAINYLNDYGNFGIKPGLERINFLLEKLGNPHKSLPCVHVAGTNGKGSVVSMLTSMLSAAGLKVGNYTSPHLESWNERININGQAVTDEELATALTAVRRVADDENSGQFTQFELITAAAFWLFKKAGLDFIVLETGMGGLLDATNVVTPECSIITNISLDHTAYLGDTMEAIAGEKAGIIKRGVPVVTATESIALNVIIDKAASLRSPLYNFRVDFIAIGLGGSISRQRILFRQGDFALSFNLNLGGDHQIANAALAVMVAKLLSEKYPSLTIAAMRTGLERAYWPSRLELRSTAPDIILDGAHNLGGAQTLRTALNKYYKGRSVCFVLGIMKDKDIKAIVEELVQPNDQLFAVRADDSDRAACPADIVAAGQGRGVICEDLSEALSQAANTATRDGVVCISGSLHLAGRVKALWRKESQSV